MYAGYSAQGTVTEIIYVLNIPYYLISHPSEALLKRPSLIKEIMTEISENPLTELHLPPNERNPSNFYDFAKVYKLRMLNHEK